MTLISATFWKLIKIHNKSNRQTSCFDPNLFCDFHLFSPWLSDRYRKCLFRCTRVWLERQRGPSLMKLYCFQSNLLLKTSKKLFSLKRFLISEAYYPPRSHFISHEIKNLKSSEKLAKLTEASETAKILFKMS